MDSITNMTTSINNGYLARKQNVSVTPSRLNQEIAKSLLAAGFLEAVVLDKESRKLKLSLRYQDGQPALRGIERVSKPSLRIYTSAKKIPPVLRGLGEVILSTPRGILTGKEAKKAKVGGELLLKVW